MKVFFDTNILLRYLIEGEKDQCDQCDVLFTAVGHGIFRAYISSVVILEFSYVLKSFYKFPKQGVRESIEDFLQMPNLTILEKTNIHKAFEIHKQTNIKLSDCMIATQIPDDMVLCTYDQDFQKILKLKAFTPQQILEQMNLKL